MSSTPILRYVGYHFDDLDGFRFPPLRAIIEEHPTRQVFQFLFGYLMVDEEGTLYFEPVNDFPVPYNSGINTFIDYCHVRADLGGPDPVDAAYQRQEKLTSSEEANPRWERADDDTIYFGAEDAK
ncbi:MAG: hypothetical protein JXA10_01790 [Anaerolineae bacterium]|nr:hypothetical protein [Anaerolineae bacterium]